MERIGSSKGHSAPFLFDDFFSLVQQPARFFQVAVVYVVLGQGDADSGSRGRKLHHLNQLFANGVGLSPFFSACQKVAQRPFAVVAGLGPFAQHFLAFDHIAQTPSRVVFELVELFFGLVQAVGVNGAIQYFSQPGHLFRGQL